MCTISWAFKPNGYDIFFNRDEQRTRARALPVDYARHQGTCAVYPVDPKGGGTWIALNEFGVSLALLNYYQGQLPATQLTSRGTIIPKLLIAKTMQQAIAELAKINLSEYAPFSLLIFANNGTGYEVIMRQWDGHQLNDVQPKSPVISSAVDFENVCASRQKLYGNLVGGENGINPNLLFGFHASHLPSASKMSVCMHREDAKTVSLSHIEVDGINGAFRYCEVSPCKLPNFHTFYNDDKCKKMLKVV